MGKRILSASKSVVRQAERGMERVLPSHGVFRGLGMAYPICRWGVARRVSWEPGMVRVALGESHSEPNRLPLISL